MTAWDPEPAVVVTPPPQEADDACRAFAPTAAEHRPTFAPRAERIQLKISPLPRLFHVEPTDERLRGI